MSVEEAYTYFWVPSMNLYFITVGSSCFTTYVEEKLERMYDSYNAEAVEKLLSVQLLGSDV